MSLPLTGSSQKFRYAGLSDDAKVAHFASFISGIWQIHPFREGNTRTTGLFAVKYLQSRGYEVTNDLFYEKSWYFRNALVRANYENSRRNEEIELKNRFLRIGSEYGSSVAMAVTGLHRGTKNSDVGINVGINVGIKLGASEEKVAAAIRSNSRVTISELAKMIKVTERQAQRIIATLKKKAGLKRRGARKNGQWYFDDPATSASRET